MWESLFAGANLLALVMWAGLIILPRWPALLSAALYLGVGVLCLTYTIALAGLLGGLIPTPVDSGSGLDFGSIEGIRSIFATDAGVTIGWIHYLAFDLFVGIWIARDADAKDFGRWVQAPILLATFLAGPFGLLIWLIVREKRARVGGVRSKIRISR